MSSSGTIKNLPTMAAESQRPDPAPINYRDSLPALRLQITTDPLDLYDDMSPKTTAPPALPTRSALRASRVLVPLKHDASDPPLSPAAPPHEVYLSSEEDASSSADDFSEYDFESESEEGKSAGRKRSCEDVAKAVPVVFSGKPTVVTVKTAPRVQRQATMPDVRMSSTPDFRRQSTFPAPPRSASLVDGPAGAQPSFLGVDPFAERGPEEEGARRGSMLRKTIGLVRKRSRPFLMTMANSSVGNLSSASLASPSPSISEGEAPSPRSRRPSAPSIKTNGSSGNSTAGPGAGQGPVTYNDIIRNVKRNEANRPRSPAPASPASPAPAISADRKSRILSGFTMSKRRSVRA